MNGSMGNNGLGKFLAGRLFKLITLLVAVSLITFILMKLSPIDPVTAYVGADSRVGAEQRELIAQQWGLDRPPAEQFLSWFSSLLSGDWGQSIIYRRPVLSVIGEKFLASLAVMAAAWALSGVIGFSLGVLSGVKEGKLTDKLIRGYCHVLISTPTFWLGILFVMVFAVWLGWFPVALSVPIGVLAEDVTMMDKLSHLVLPVLTLSVINIAGICMHTREKTVEVLRSDYVLFAKARGENRRQIVRSHVLRNVSLPAITLQFLSFSELFGGAVFVEQVFSYPGLGQAAVQAGLRGDVPLLMGITIISLLFVYTGNTAADLLYRAVDPRIRERYAR
ncbi:ABC transporter permease [Bacilliculturomica massiliensis]|uniref:ABC transporter permease n=1 Tax=Bacilliculturomica massiliensis TaxID=1917867 RepID=UPI001FE4A162|nr:ABC transporter permease [Bacilliculturomica massiliensis]